MTLVKNIAKPGNLWYTCANEMPRTATNSRGASEQGTFGSKQYNTIHCLPQFPLRTLYQRSV